MTGMMEAFPDVSSLSSPASDDKYASQFSGTLQRT